MLDADKLTWRDLLDLVKSGASPDTVGHVARALLSGADSDKDVGAAFMGGSDLSSRPDYKMLCLIADLEAAAIKNDHEGIGRSLRRLSEETTVSALGFIASVAAGRLMEASKLSEAGSSN